VIACRQRTATHPLITPSLLKNRGFTSGLLVCLVAVAAGPGLLFVLSLFLQEGLHVSPRDTSLGLVPLTLGLVAAGFAAMGGLVARLGRRLVFTGLTIDLAGCGWVLALVNHSGTNVTLWTLAPAFFVIGIGIGLSFATIPAVALGDAKPDEAGSASGSGAKQARRHRMSQKLSQGGMRTDDRCRFSSASSQPRRGGG